MSLWMVSKENNRYVHCASTARMKREERLTNYLDSTLIDLTMKTKIEYRLFPH